MAAPVIDPDTQEMLGIVTVDDAIDIVLPTAWKKKNTTFCREVKDEKEENNLATLAAKK